MNNFKDYIFTKKFMFATISLIVFAFCVVLVFTLSNQALAEEKAAESNALQLGKITIHPEKAKVSGYYQGFDGTEVYFDEDIKEFDMSNVVQGKTLRISSSNGCSYQISKGDSALILNMSLVSTEGGFASLYMFINMPHIGWDSYCLHDNVSELNDDYVYFLDDGKANNFDFYEAADSPVSADILINANSNHYLTLYLLELGKESITNSFENCLPIHLENAHYATYKISFGDQVDVSFYDDNDLCHYYRTNCKVKVGYDFDGISPVIEPDKSFPVTEDMTFEMKAKPTSYTYNIILNINEDSGPAITGDATLKYYDSKGEFVDTLVKNSDNQYTLPNSVNAEKASGMIVGTAANYPTNIFVFVSPFGYSFDKHFNYYTCFYRAFVSENEFFNLSKVLDGTVNNWSLRSFAYTGSDILFDGTAALSADFQSVKLSQRGFLMFMMGGMMTPAPAANDEYDVIFKANENGTLSMSMTVLPHMSNAVSSTMGFDFVPHFIEGKEFDYWKVNDDNLTASQSKVFNLMSTEQINTQLYSKDVVPGGGGGSEDINSSAQTGDMGIYAIVALAIITIAAGAVIASRRRSE